MKLSNFKEEQIQKLRRMMKLVKANVIRTIGVFIPTVIGVTGWMDVKDVT